MKISSVKYSEELIARLGLDGAFSVAQDNFEGAKKGLLSPLANTITNPVERNNRIADERASKKLLGFWDHVFGIVHKRKYPDEKRDAV